MLKNIDVDSIEERHLKAQVDLAVPEVRDVDYKRTLPEKSETAELLADVCSFANAGGGDLVYGVAEEGGIPTDLSGVETDDPDAELLRLEQRILSGIAPRIPGLRGRYVPLSNGNHVYVIRVPRSFSRPHAVQRSDGTPRFVTRNSAGKYTMDVDEIRGAFLAAGAVADRMRAFRAGRLADVVAGETPADFRGAATVVLHVMPLSAFDAPSPSVDLDAAKNAPGGFLPIGLGGDLRHNFDGLLVHGDYARGASGTDGRMPESYALLFRSGVVEAADSMLLWPRRSDVAGIYPEGLERGIIEGTDRYLALLAHLGVEGPVYVALTLLGVKGHDMLYESVRSSSIRPVDRDALVVPEVAAEGPRLDRVGVATLLRPVFDQVWNACGYPRSLLYDAGGRWVGDRR